MNKTFIIAEIGVNHNANLDLAIDMIDSAALTGVDAIKFQTAIPELVQTSTAPKAEYQKNTTDNPNESQLEMSKKFHFEHSVFITLKKEVEKRGKIFLSTAFDLKSLDFLTSLGETVYKIPSGEITNLPYIRAIAKRAKKVFLSTGMATFDEVKEAVDVLLKGGLKAENIIVLQCNTEYPSPFEDVNLLAMVEMGKKLGLEYGLSDHTPGVEASIAAVALGATIIEKHFTIDRNLPGPDQHASLLPFEFHNLVNSIRNVEKAMGISLKFPTESEIKNKFIARRSIYLSKDVKKGDLLTYDNLIALRPEAGISPMKIDEIIGKIALNDLKANSLITSNDF
jgi:N,N'-diacetyllegionaminate synthase